MSLIDEVCAQWESLLPEIQLSVKVKDVNVASGILAFSTHALRLAPEIAAMLRDNLGWAVTPLVRLCFECGITAQWVRHVPDGLAVVAKEAYRQRRAFVRAVERSSLQLDERFESLAQEADPDWLRDISSEVSARVFEQRCRDLAPGGAEYYVMYRYLCAQTHAGPGLIDAYFKVNEESPDELPTFVPYQQQTSDLVLAHLTATSAVWAGRALGMVIKGDKKLEQFRVVLRSAARVLELPAELRLAGGAWVRTNRPRSART